MKRLHRLSDAELLTRTAHDHEAFAAFYRRHERLVLRYLQHRTRNPEVSADLLVETFAAALEGASRFNPDLAGRESAVGWLLAIARNVWRMSVRSGVVSDEVRRQLGSEPLHLDDADLERIAALGEEEGTLEKLVAELPPSQREAVIARVLDERDYAEIAAQIGCSELVVRKRVSRGLSRLRSAMTTSAP